VKQITVCKPLYEEELLKHGQNDLASMDIQLVKGVLPDLFSGPKFLESDNDLVYNGIICVTYLKSYRLL